MGTFQEILRLYGAVHAPANAISDNVAIPEIFLESPVIAEEKARPANSSQSQRVGVVGLMGYSLAYDFTFGIDL